MFKKVIEACLKAFKLFIVYHTMFLVASALPLDIIIRMSLWCGGITPNTLQVCVILSSDGLCFSFKSQSWIWEKLINDFIFFCKKVERDIVIFGEKGKAACNHIVTALKPKELKANSNTVKGLLCFKAQHDVIKKVKRCGRFFVSWCNLHRTRQHPTMLDRK